MTGTPGVGIDAAEADVDVPKRTTRPRPRYARRGQPLTERERDVLPHIAAGFDTDSIALVMGISRETVKTHIGRVLVKIGANNRAHLVHIAHMTGLLDRR